MARDQPSLVDTVTNVLAAAEGAGRRLTFLHVPKCFGTSFSGVVRRLFPALQFSAGHHDPYAALSVEGALLVSSVRDPAARLRSVLLHALRDNKPEGFCPPAMFPVLTGFVRRPTAGGLREYLTREYRRASYLHWFRPFVGDATADMLLDRAAATDGAPSAADVQRIESYADVVMHTLDICLYDDPKFMRWLPVANSARSHATRRLHPSIQCVEEVCEEVVAERPGVLRCEQVFYDRCVKRQFDRLGSHLSEGPGRAEAAAAKRMLARPGIDEIPSLRPRSGRRTN